MGGVLDWLTRFKAVESNYLHLECRVLGGTISGNTAPCLICMGRFPKLTTVTGTLYLPILPEKRKGSGTAK